MELLALPKARGRGAEPLREVGPHPYDGQPIYLFKGRFGPYVKHGKVNASLSKGTEPEEVTVELAVELLRKRVEWDAAKKARGRSARPRKRSTRP